ncbi:MAG: hypothetical protein KJ726_08825, partial [Verrucomicrobia bacterium]|nr:hypothetical protein [Verrucomicrobiota bacterium]
VCNARDRFLGKQRVEGYLPGLDMRGEDEIHDPCRLERTVLDVLTAPTSRGDLVIRAMRKVFGEYKEAEHRRIVGDMIRRGKMFSRSGKSRINDHETLSRKPFKVVEPRHD